MKRSRLRKKLKLTLVFDATKVPMKDRATLMSKIEKGTKIRGLKMTDVNIG